MSAGRIRSCARRGARSTLERGSGADPRRSAAPIGSVVPCACAGANPARKSSGSASCAKPAGKPEGIGAAGNRLRGVGATCLPSGAASDAGSSRGEQESLACEDHKEASLTAPRRRAIARSVGSPGMGEERPTSLSTLPTLSRSGHHWRRGAVALDSALPASALRPLLSRREARSLVGSPGRICRSQSPRWLPRNVRPGGRDIAAIAPGSRQHRRDIAVGDGVISRRHRRDVTVGQRDITALGGRDAAIAPGSRQHHRDIAVGDGAISRRHRRDVTVGQRDITATSPRRHCRAA